jgi:hypothetical protein
MRIVIGNPESVIGIDFEHSNKQFLILISFVLLRPVMLNQVWLRRLRLGAVDIVLMLVCLMLAIQKDPRGVKQQ